MSDKIEFVGKPERIPGTPVAVFRFNKAPPTDWLKLWSSSFGRIEGDVLVVAVPEKYPKTFLDTLKAHLNSVNSIAATVRKLVDDQDLDRALEEF